jgi:short-subunit dehydrogenase
MQTFKEKYGPVALIAGASEGLGAAWAEALAKRGLDLVLIARRKERLDEITASLVSKYKIRTWSLPCDLATPDAAKYIADETKNIPVSCIVYNAASSYIGPFLKNSADENERIIAVNITTPLLLVRDLADRMIEARKGAIILMSSLAGFQGSGFLSLYASSKAFTRVLAESLWYEWKSKGIDVIACCAGAVSTPNFIQSNPGKMGRLAPRPQQPEEVVEECLKRLGKTPSFISGKGNRIASLFMQRIFTRKKAVTIMGNATRKIYKVKD